MLHTDDWRWAAIILASTIPLWLMLLVGVGFTTGVWLPAGLFVAIIFCSIMLAVE